MYILVEWIYRRSFSAINFKSITSPRKEYEEYSVGEELQARYEGKVYPARIVKNRVSLLCDVCIFIYTGSRLYW